MDGLSYCSLTPQFKDLHLLQLQFTSWTLPSPAPLLTSQTLNCLITIYFSWKLILSYSWLALRYLVLLILNFLLVHPFPTMSMPFHPHDSSLQPLIAKTLITLLFSFILAVLSQSCLECWSKLLSFRDWCTTDSQCSISADPSTPARNSSVQPLFAYSLIFLNNYLKSSPFLRLLILPLLPSLSAEYLFH